MPFQKGHAPYVRKLETIENEQGLGGPEQKVKMRYEFTVVGPDWYRRQFTVEVDDESEAIEIAKKESREGVVSYTPAGFIVEPLAIQQVYVKKL